jgi:uncharacterized protein (DUF1499 family)
LLPCLQESNCISSSSISSFDKYGIPWESDRNEAVDVLWNRLKNAVKSDQLLKIVESDDEKHYLRAEARSAVPLTGTDDVEFLLIPKDDFITYRSNSRELVRAGLSIVGDGGSHRNRLENVRRRAQLVEMNQNKDELEYMRENENLNFFQRMQRASLPNDINFIDNSTPLDSDSGSDAD